MHAADHFGDDAEVHVPHAMPSPGPAECSPHSTSRPSSTMPTRTPRSSACRVEHQPVHPAHCRRGANRPRTRPPTSHPPRRRLSAETTGRAVVVVVGERDVALVHGEIRADEVSRRVTLGRAVRVEIHGVHGVHDHSLVVSVAERRGRARRRRRRRTFERTIPGRRVFVAPLDVFVRVRVFRVFVLGRVLGLLQAWRARRPRPRRDNRRGFDDDSGGYGQRRVPGISRANRRRSPPGTRAARTLDVRALGPTHDGVARVDGDELELELRADADREDPLPLVRVVRVAHGVHLAGVPSDRPPSPMSPTRTSAGHARRTLTVTAASVRSSGLSCTRRFARRPRRDERAWYAVGAIAGASGRHLARYEGAVTRRRPPMETRDH